MTVFSVYLDRRFDSSALPPAAPDPADIDHWRITIQLEGGATGGEWSIALNPGTTLPPWRQFNYGPFSIGGSSDYYDFQMPELASTYYGYNCEAVITYVGGDGTFTCNITIPADPVVPEFTVSNLTPTVGEQVTITPIAKSKAVTTDGINFYEIDTTTTIPVEGLQTTNATQSYWSAITTPVITSWHTAGTYSIAGYASSFYTYSYNSVTGPGGTGAYYIYYSQTVTVSGGGGGPLAVDFSWTPNPITSSSITVTFEDISTVPDIDSGAYWMIGNEGVDLSGISEILLDSSLIMYGFAVGYDENAALIIVRNGVTLPEIAQPLWNLPSPGDSFPPPTMITAKTFSITFPRAGFYDVWMWRGVTSPIDQGTMYHRIEVGNFVGQKNLQIDNIIVTNPGVQFPTAGGGGTGGGGGGYTPGEGGNIPDGYFKFWRAEDVFNNKNELCMKWLVCDTGRTVSATANGTGYRTVPLKEDDFERGWWSANRSDDNGFFTNPEWVQSEWTTPRLVTSLQLNLMYGYPPMDMVMVEYKDTNQNWIPVNTPGFAGAVDPEDFIWTHTFTVPIEIIGLRATVLSTQLPNDWARLSELNAFYIVDVSEDVITIDIKEDMEFYESNVAMPKIAAKSADITFNNIEGKYNSFDPYDGYVIGANTKFSIYLSKFNNDTLAMEETYFGDYYSDSWSNDSTSLTASVQCRDASKFLQDQMTFWDKMWIDTSVDAVLIELLLMNDIPLRRIDIDGNNTTIGQVYLKQSTPWELFGELALASFSMFRFKRDNVFKYDDLISSTGVGITLSPSTNMISASMQTQVYANKLTVKVNPVIKEENKLISLWAAPSPTILSWSQLGADINAESSTITVETAPRQSGFNLSTYGWPDRGYLFLYELAYENRGGHLYPMVINGEVVKYNSRTDSAFTDIERGALYTATQDWPQGTKIGQLVMFNMEFNNAPAEDIRFPFVTAINVLSYDDVEATKQAHVVLWEHDAASGRLAIANIADYYTWLAGTGQTARDIDDIDHDVEIDFATAVAGVARVQVNSETVTETINNPEQTLANLVRRYGKNEIQIDSPFIQTREAAEQLLDRMISIFRNPVPEWTVKITAMPEIDLKDRLIQDALDGFDPYGRSIVVIGNTIRYDGGVDQEIRVRRDLD